MRYLQKKYPNFQQNGLAFQNLTLKWRSKNGMMSFDQSRAAVNGSRIAIAGTYDAARRGLDAYTRVQIHETSPELLKELPATYLYRGGGRTQVQPMHGRIQGTPTDWRLRAVPSSKVPAATLNKLRKD